MNTDALMDTLTALVRGSRQADCQPWHAAALRAWEKQHVQMIPSRDGTALYLARFWLTPPTRVGCDDGAPFESGSSVLLHYFARGDDDGSLHTHPWAFSTDVLSGGYTERRPPKWWRDYHENPYGAPKALGITLAACDTLIRRAGDPRQHRQASSEHAVEDVLPDTWTLMVTGPRTQSWWFHPPYDEAVPWRDFLAEKRQQVAL